ncbi:hypothetical protein CDAR_608591 [Caerostris darwini]|uniref:Uncharacterized protein n=1 Tax=Caerostris darwini TaxID=1538125 RepID=A0AAV4WJ10_9ARAC|nr:hypothetical protein CDAR_608591 [Caerostris darwini]
MILPLTIMPMLIMKPPSVPLEELSIPDNNFLKYCPIMKKFALLLSFIEGLDELTKKFSWHTKSCKSPFISLACPSFQHSLPKLNASIYPIQTGEDENCSKAAGALKAELLCQGSNGAVRHLSFVSSGADELLIVTRRPV